MKNKGIIFIVVYIILVVGLFFSATKDYFTVILLLLFPLTLVLASIKISFEETVYEHKALLISASSASVILCILPFLVGRLGFNQIWDYSNYLFYISVLLISIAVFIVVKNAISTKTSLKNSLDIIIILIPLTAFFITEFYLNNSFIHKQKVERIDLLTIELQASNESLANILGVEYSIPFGLEFDHSDSLTNGHLIKSIDNLLQEVLKISGGYKLDENQEISLRLLKPHNTDYPNIALKRSVFYEKIRSEFEKAKSNETDSQFKRELSNIQADLFNEEVLNDNSVLEMRFRCYIAENRLLSLELKKRISISK